MRVLFAVSCGVSAGMATIVAVPCVWVTVAVISGFATLDAILNDW